MIAALPNHSGWLGCLLLAGAPVLAQSPSDFARFRETMVRDEIKDAGVKNERVLRAMLSTPRHEFVARSHRRNAYFDMALPIGEGQTISPPFVVAYMTEQLDPQPTDRVLEIGTGSGYQAAVLSHLVREVYSIEIVETLGRKAARTLRRLKYDNVRTKIGDGFAGWPEYAPFDKIIVTCSPESVPQPLIDQLAEGGRMVVPTGERYAQNLHLLTKRDNRLEKESLRATLFVPMTGAAERHREVLPDPLHPRLRNGDFEDTTGDPPAVSGWHYQRQLTLVDKDPLAPAGEKYVQFKNETPGRSARALQGFAIDGRRIPLLIVQLSVKGRDIQYGQTSSAWPYVMVTFFDQRRAMISSERLGPFSGTFAWKAVRKPIRVPLKAREAIFRVDLFGATGQLCVDDVRITPADD